MNPDGVPEQAIRAASERGYIALSRAVFSEIAEVLSRPKFVHRIDDRRRKAVLQQLNAASMWFETNDIVRDCRDTDDNKYLELALAARATAIITGDKDLLTLHPWRGIHILSPTAFLTAEI